MPRETLVKKLFHWFNNHKSTNFLILFGYYLAVVLPHKRFGTFLNEHVFKPFSRSTYNSIILSIVVCITGWILYTFYKNTAPLSEKKVLRRYMIASILFAAIIASTLFVINIEFIHFPQYAIFAILVFPLVRCYREALVWSVLAGAIDEAFQYFYLAPNDTAYYDFNDVITNLVGAALGLIYLRSFNVTEKPSCSIRTSSAFKACLFLGAVISVLVWSNILSIYPSTESTFQLVRTAPTSFWSEVPLGFTYHVISPMEGVVILSLLLLFYRNIGKSVSQ